MLVLTWIKGEPLPGELVDDTLKAIGLDRLMTGSLTGTLNS